MEPEKEKILELIESNNIEDIKLGIILALKNLDVDFWEENSYGRWLWSDQWRTFGKESRSRVSLAYVDDFYFISQEKQITVGVGFGSIIWASNNREFTNFISKGESVDITYID